MTRSSARRANRNARKVAAAIHPDTIITQRSINGAFEPADVRRIVFEHVRTHTNLRRETLEEVNWELAAEIMNRISRIERPVMVW